MPYRTAPDEAPVVPFFHEEDLVDVEQKSYKTQDGNIKITKRRYSKKVENSWSREENPSYEQCRKTEFTVTIFSSPCHGESDDCSFIISESNLNLLLHHLKSFGKGCTT